MQRSAIQLALTGLLLASAGCGLFKKKEAATTTATDYPVQDTYTNTQSYPTDTGAGFASTASTYGSTASTRYHTVQKKETLYSLARSYYGDHTKWRVIYDANRSDIGEDPNRIRVGQKLVIP